VDQTKGRVSCKSLYLCCNPKVTGLAGPFGRTFIIAHYAFVQKLA